MGNYPPGATQAKEGSYTIKFTMYYVYRLQSEKSPDRSYIGFSADLKQRFKDHNAGKNRYSAPFRPWKLVFYSAFNSEAKSRAFEAYLKTGSGAAFGNKRLW